ncbi:type IX secretion system PorP/SprF family membrane protein [Flavobacterium aquaticum]|uniref:Type IX secretion system PorP/SprF family membrane protein n=1 Tax=Flavobacterium aquaticum TaxID=1236486 RepID=A0A327YWM8_9FLAO|nr:MULTISPECIES: type IX secretion system membrane protein PorP/SprF [Flavobacterium]MCK6608509.1 type IX secretion system membrane protein PorP/SprF [Flavobacterium sp.]RAK25252.1 type IX secretion system PorP/SprF family membrane protein [Flavobacterium aquaticum]
MKTILTIICAFILQSMCYSQQDSQYTQYMYNTPLVNPAYAGSRETITAFLLHRNQWVGLDGAPVTNNFSINMPVGDSNFGVGLNFVNDEIGPVSENEFSVDLAYFIQVSENYKLSLGLKGTANLFQLDVNKLRVFDPTDPQFQNMDTEFSPNVGAGLYLFSDKTYFGLSVPSFFESYRYNDNNIEITKEKMHFYFIAGHVFTLSENIDFKPALLSKIVEGAPLQADVTANFLFFDKLTLGAAYRWDASVSALAGFQISDSWFIGYGYDLETTKLANYNSGSHEIFLRYEFFNRSRVSAPRFF